jgi:hypothetical protein
VNIPESSILNPDAVAVVIGVKNYSNIEPVKFAVHDAKIVKEYFKNIFGIKKDNILYYENANKGDLEGIFGNKGELYNRIKPGKSDVFVYYSGHGLPDIESRKAYLAPVETKSELAKLQGYSLDLLYENLNALPAKSVTVIIEACFSGTSGDNKTLISNASSIGIEPIISIPSKINVFTASQEKEVASWYTEKQHGLFTYYLLKALKDNYGKGKKLTYGELADYLKNNVPGTARSMMSREQTPTFNGDKNKVLVEY